MAKAKRSASKKKAKGKYDIMVKPPKGMAFEDLIKLAANTPPTKKQKPKK